MSVRKSNRGGCSRRGLATLLGVLFLFSLNVPLGAEAETGIRALDEPAIAVKAPNRVSLIAITRAGTRLVAVGEHGVITYSDDNGISWHQSRVPVTVTLTCVAFSNPEIGWAAGHYGVILHSIDGGKTWQLQMTGIEANQLTLEAANQAVAQNANDEVAKRALRRANIFIAAGPDKPFLSILADSDTDATVVGAYRMMLKTADGGRSWTDWNVHIGDKLSHNLYDIFSVGKAVYITGEMGLVFGSTDGGNEFPEVTQPTSATLLGGIAVANNAFLVFGVAGQAFRSTDGGMTWQPISFGTDATLVAAHTLRSGAVMVASESGALYTSSDAGMTFQPATEALPMALSDFTESADGDIVAVGNQGIIRIDPRSLSQH